MAEHATPQKIPLIFFRSGKGTEPVRPKPNVRPQGEICYERSVSHPSRDREGAVLAVRGLLR